MTLIWKVLPLTYKGKRNKQCIKTITEVSTLNEGTSIASIHEEWMSLT